ncbi:alpha/beta hydrolase [Levilactobacillus spicheri]|uniref:alpha/beta hydrolase n=1 Tax=Levilactobacillus spicheri TaxID=216463 RepID=UPI000B0E6768|nr:alpha/beta hydrolase [Levilactobacillus spicheri]
MITFNYVATPQKVPFEGSYYPAPRDTPHHPTIIYVHGGGLLFGNRQDLPIDYIQLFHQAGYPVICLDYCLAPESLYPQILSSLEDGVRFVLKHVIPQADTALGYILFGRSAGAFLAMQLISQGNVPRPLALLDLYGFPSLDIPAFNQPSLYYQKYPSVKLSVRQQLIETSPITHSTNQNRFLLYVAARQSGNWCSTILGTTPPPTLSSTDLHHFPPTYILQSASDPDVPFSNSLQLKAHLNHAKLSVAVGAEHDFDRQVTPKNLAYYRNMIEWLNDQC